MAKDPTKRAQKRPWSDALARRLRLARGRETQQDWANKIGVSTASISSWESGDTAPTLDNLEQISRMTGYSMDWFLGRGPEDLPEQIAAGESASRHRVAFTAAAVIEAMIGMRRVSSPEDVSSMLLATLDWASANEKERGATPSYGETVTFVRHAMQMRQSV